MPSNPPLIQLHERDNVVIATSDLSKGERVASPVGETLTIGGEVRAAHKIALRSIRAGEAVYRYGQVIGAAGADIAAGEHVHTHNLIAHESEIDSEFSADAKPVDLVPLEQRRTFQGFRRPGGGIGTRNYIAVVSSVNCSAHTCNEIAAAFGPEELARYPNVDGVIALTHSSGCGGCVSGTINHAYLQRTLAGMIRNPNIAASLLVGLGCESQQIPLLLEEQGFTGEGRPRPPVLTIQTSGGIKKTVEQGIGIVKKFLPVANAAKRSSEPISELKVAMECGGSDGWSGITANPLIGRISDELARNGGTACTSETTEMFGAEHLLVRRSVDRSVGLKLLAKLTWWREYLDRHGEQFDNNPSPGNKVGGLSNIVEKSLGAVAKGGSTPLVQVYEYAQPITHPGFVIMDSPGYDPVSVTGKVAGGCNMVLFSTGRGSAFGFKPAPSIKIASNSALYEHMIDDMDVDAGAILTTDGGIDAAADRLMDLVIEVASGAASKSERQGVGAAEFIPWQPGPIL